jgi:hypothetical protein
VTRPWWRRRQRNIAPCSRQLHLVHEEQPAGDGGGEAAAASGRRAGSRDRASSPREMAQTSPRERDSCLAVTTAAATAAVSDRSRLLTSAPRAERER